MERDIWACIGISTLMTFYLPCQQTNTLAPFAMFWINGHNWFQRSWSVTFGPLGRTFDIKVLSALFSEQRAFRAFSPPHLATIRWGIKWLTKMSCFGFVRFHSKMINLSVPDTIDERTINKKKLTPFTIQVRWVYTQGGCVSSCFLCIPFWTSDASPLAGESEPGPELGFCYRLPRGKHWSFRPKRGEAPSCAGPAVADHKDRSVRWHRAQQKWRYGTRLMGPIRERASPGRFVHYLDWSAALLHSAGSIAERRGNPGGPDEAISRGTAVALGKLSPRKCRLAEDQQLQLWHQGGRTRYH